MKPLKHQENGRAGDQQGTAVMPAGWKTLPFEDCIEHVKYTKKVQRKEFLNEGTFPIVSQEADFTIGYWNDENDVFRVTTPVVIFGDHTQVLKYVDFDFVLGADGVKILLPCKFLHPKFLYYQLQSVDFELLGYARHYKLLKEMEICFPPLAEQQRIVAILDEAFEGIATARKHAEQNLQNAKALFESHLEAVFSQKGEGWVETNVPLAELCELIVDCEHKTAPTQVDGIPSIRTPNIGKGKLLLDGVNRVSVETYQAWTRRAEPQAGDLIFAREAPAGNVAVVPENTQVCLGQRTVLIRPNAQILDSTFLALRILEPHLRNRLLDHSRGATVQHVNMKDIRALNIGAIPPICEQRRIASILDAISTYGDDLTDIYTQKIAALDALKKSLLHQAFSGEL